MKGDGVDRVFGTSTPASRFSFDAEVADVFDDMARRSIPLYVETHDWVANHLRHHPAGEGAIVDLGTSTGTLLRRLRDAGLPNPLVGVEPSQPMLDIARLRLDGRRGITLVHADAAHAPLEDTAAVTALYTLQFIDPSERPRILQRVAEGLQPGGRLYLAEKTCDEDLETEEEHRRLYEAWKARQGYSAVEIERKRAALDGVLIRWSERRWRTELEAAGLPRIRVFGRFLHFVLLVADRGPAAR